MVAVSRPKTLGQALDTLASGEHILFAGGTDLMVRRRVRPNVPADFEQHVVFTDDLEELKQIQPISEGVRIGAAVTMEQALKDTLVPELLKKSLLKIAAPALRNRATIAGNICNASPAADTLPPLYLLDACVVLTSLGGSRTLPISDFIKGPGQTELCSGELLTQIEIPLPTSSDTALPLCCYHKVGTRAANALTKVSFVGGARIGHGIITDWRVAFGAVGPTVVRDRGLEARVIGQPDSVLKDSGFVGSLLEGYGEIIRPIDDQRSTALYRKTTALNLLRRYLHSLSPTN